MLCNEELFFFGLHPELKSRNNAGERSLCPRCEAVLGCATGRSESDWFPGTLDDIFSDVMSGEVVDLF
jgi:hypothetical protein